MRSRSTPAGVAVLSTVAVLTAGCLGAAVEDPAPRPDEPPTIEVMYPVSSDLGEPFQEEVRRWAQRADVEVEFSPTGNLDELIATRVQGNDAPDVALFTDPVPVRNLAADGRLLELSAVVDPADRSAMHPSLLAAGQVDDGYYAVPVGVHVSSLVFHPRAVAGQVPVPQPPSTLEELRSLSERIAATGTTPWCFGVESEDVPGWPATDWVEDLVLINHGSAVYEQWVDHEIAFDDPRIADVLEQMETLLLQEGRSHGGREAILDTGVSLAVAPMFTEPPGCHLYRQGSSLIADGFPDDVVDEIDDRVGVFPMPGLTQEQNPVVGSAHLATVMNHEEEAARDLVRFLASPDFGRNELARSGTWISPRTDFDMALYPNETWRTVAGIAHGATEFVFDGSDQMPREVGFNSFPRQLMAWIEGDQDVATTLENIEASWPS